LGTSARATDAFVSTSLEPEDVARLGRSVIAATVGALTAGRLLFAARHRKQIGITGAAAALGLGGWAMLHGAGGVIRHYRRAMSESFRAECHAALGAALVRIHELNNAPFSDYGLHAFIVQRSLPRMRYLERVAAVKLGAHPSPTRIRWTRGKGIVGQCWAQQQVVIADTGSLYGQLDSIESSFWRTLPESVSMSLSHREAELLRKRYRGAAAVPIIDINGWVRGCVTLDTFAGANFEQIVNPISLSVVEDAVASIANSLAAVLPGVFDQGDPPAK
jgi:hypothetical protein